MRRAASAIYRIHGTQIASEATVVPDLAAIIAQGPKFEHAACATRDPEMWSDRQAIVAGRISNTGLQAIAICNRCVHKLACLELALSNGEQHGIWGGLTPQERKEMTA